VALNDRSTKVKAAEFFFWISFSAIFWTFNTLTTIADRERQGIEFNHTLLYTTEATSAIAALIMLPFLIRWTSQHPFEPNKTLKFIVRHLLGSIIFTLGHVGLFVTLRELLFNNYVANFVGDSLLSTLLYEYRKDVGLYLIWLIIITIYRQYRERQAHQLDKNEQRDRLLVRTRNGEKLIKHNNIVWLKAAANYVEIHTEEQMYLIRATMTQMEKKLGHEHFARSHKSFIVQIDMINEIAPTESGDYRITTKSGAVIPLSRRYRGRIETVIPSA